MGETKTELDEILVSKDTDRIQRWLDENAPDTGREIDYRNQGWGHAVAWSNRLGDYGHSAAIFVFGKSPLVGDRVIINVGGMPCIYVVAESKWNVDPKDMYKVKLIGSIGYKGEAWKR